MTTHTHINPNDLPAAPAVDPYPNKAIAAAVTTLATVIVQLATSDWKLSLDQEGITAIGGAIATILVYAISNWRRRGL
jgi:hypothetical protein